MNITKEILRWADKQYEDAISNPECKHPYVKASVSGFTEGFIDGAVVGAVILVGAGIIQVIKDLKK